jgi:hypothetical protein
MNLSVGTVPETPANLQAEYSSRSAEFEAIDQFVRAHLRRWATVAQQCLRVKEARLYEEGGFHSWEAWIQSAAPDEKSKRTVYYHTGMLSDLAADFTVEELDSIPPETAKVLRECSTSVRRDPRVRQAAKARKGHFIEAIQELHPNQHVLSTTKVSFHFEDEFIPIYEEFLEVARAIEEDPGLERERAFELSVMAYLQQPWGDPSVGISNLARFRQLRGLKCQSE